MAHRILIIDDNADIRWMLTDLLESHGYHCEKASNAITALTMIQEGSFDLILTDYQMPRMTGIELLQNLSRLSATSTVPVIMITATANDAVSTEALQAGACAVLRKPINFDELLSSVELTIANSRSQNTEPCPCHCS